MPGTGDRQADARRDRPAGAVAAGLARDRAAHPRTRRAGELPDRLAGLKWMWTRADIEQAVVDHPQQASDALAAVQLDKPGPVLEAAALRAVATMLGRDPGEFWVEQLD